MNGLTILIYALILKGFISGAAIASFIFILILVIQEISKNEHSRRN